MGIRQSDGQRNNATTDATTTLGMAPVVGNYLVATPTGPSNSGPTWTPPSAAWTLLAESVHTNRRMQAWGKPVEASDGSTFTFVCNISGTQVLHVWELTDIDLDNPLDGAPVYATDGTSATNTLTLGPTSALSDDPNTVLAAVSCAGTTGGGHSFTNGFTEDVAADVDTAIFGSRIAADTEPMSTTVAWANSRRVHGFILAFAYAEQETDPGDGGGGTATTVFREGNWWEKPLPADAPIHPNNALYLSELNGTYNGAGTDGTYATAGGMPLNSEGNAYLALTGGISASATSYDTPIYRVGPGDTSYTLTKLSGSFFVPREFLSLADGGTGEGIRIPEVAKQHFLLGGAQSNDAPMLIVDEDRGYYANLARALWNASANRWEIQSIGAASIYYLDSYGVSGAANQTSTSPVSEWDATLAAKYADEPRNWGFRGNNPMVRVIDYDRMIAEGGIRHVMEMFAVRTGESHIFPMSGHENGKGGLIGEGVRLRLKASLTDTQIRNRLAAKLSGTRLDQAVMIAQGWRDYGVYLGDNSGSGSRVKVQNFTRENRSNPWRVDEHDLDTFDFHPTSGDWEFIADNYDPPYEVTEPPDPPPPLPSTTTVARWNGAGWQALSISVVR